MSNWRGLLGVMGILLIATVGGAAAQTAAPAANPNQAMAQAEKPAAGARVKNWTQSKLDAAKKRWAQNQQKFTDCQKQLEERKKEKRLSLRKQGHFLEQCMLQKP